MGGKGSGPRKGQSPRSGHRINDDKPMLNRVFQRELRELGADTVNLRDLEDTAVRVNQYFDLCDKYGMAATKTGLGVAVGYSVRNGEFWSVTHGTRVIGAPGATILKKAVQIIEQEMEMLALKGNVGAIFTLKANYGWKEQNEMTVTHQNALASSSSSPEEIAAKYDALRLQQQTEAYVELAESGEHTAASAVFDRANRNAQKLTETRQEAAAAGDAKKD